MSIVVAVLFETDRLRAEELRWPLRIAALHGGDVTFLVAATAESAKVTKVDLSPDAANAPPTSELGASLRVLLDQELTPEGWVAADPRTSTDEKAADAGEASPIGVALEIIPTGQFAARVLPSVDEARRDLLVCVLPEPPRQGTPWDLITTALLRDAHCQVIHVIPGRRQADGEILFEPSREQYARVASPLAWQLAQHYQRKATGLWVQSEIGADSERVGQRMLEQVLDTALDHDAAHVDRRVEIADSRDRGILRACTDERYELVILGNKRLGAAALGEARVPVRVARGTNQPTVIIARGAVPIRTRFLRRLDFQLRRTVPQLEREERVAFVTRIQSSSRWDFDFMALMGLAAAIATFGLIGDSPAVIIGAMLVAPLMTPLMGIGLAIVQGNEGLAGMTLRTSALGFVLAFVLAFGIGSLDSEFGIATEEMRARHWPSLVDLAVAFVSGLAAAYATGRPGLLAALPGVAIAASLVPPIAASGLAVSIGNYDLAIGAVLLFAVNMVAIVLATALVLWGVGLRSGHRLSLWSRLATTGVVLLAVAMAVGLAVSPPRSAPPLALVNAVEAALDEEARLRRIRLIHEDGPVIQIDLGVSAHALQKPRDDLLAVVRKYVGDKPTVRVTYRVEDDLK